MNILPYLSMDKIWLPDGSLMPLDAVQPNNHGRRADVAILIVARDRPDLTSVLLGKLQDMKCGDITADIFIVEMGSAEKHPKHNFWYVDDPYRGKAYGHNVALRLAANTGHYDYYWILMNDVWPTHPRDMYDLVTAFRLRDDAAIISPTGNFGYLGARTQKHGEYRQVASVDYLSFMIRSKDAHRYFINPDFNYCWGCELEMCAKLWGESRATYYADKVVQEHVGTSTWGKLPNLPSRREYIRRAKAFVVPYLIDHYGYNWDDVFSSHLPDGLLYNTFKLHRAQWQGLGGDKPKLLRLNLFCGDNYLPDFINMDVEPQQRMDWLYQGIQNLPFIKPESVASIRIPGDKYDQWVTPDVWSYWEEILVAGGHVTIDDLKERG